MAAIDFPTLAGDSTGGAAIEELHSDVLTGVLRLLDGPSLAAASCASSHLRAATAGGRLWEELCLTSWPSLRLLPSLPNSPADAFFFDAYNFPRPDGRKSGGPPPPAALISAVDLLHDGRLVLSKVVETDARGRWFCCSPFRVDAVGTDEVVAAAPVSPAGLTLQWVLIDPASGRAVNLSSRRPVEVERRWYTGEILVRFAAVLDEGRAAAVAVVTLAEETMEVREARLAVEDVDGASLNGRDSLALLASALAGGRRTGAATGEEEARRNYAEFARRAARRKEQRLKGWESGAAVRRIAAAAVIAVLAALVFM